MSGLRILQTPCLAFNPFDVSRMHSANKTPALPFTKSLCIKRTTVRAKVAIDDQKTGSLTIQEVPYVDEVVKRLSQKCDAFRKSESDPAYLEEAYQKCRMVCAEHDKLLSSASRHLTEERQRAIWAMCAWGRRIDEFVDSLNDENLLSSYLDHWEGRTKDILNGRPHDILDAALVDTLSKFDMDPVIFEDLMKGMRMDITKNRYANFEELFFFCYCMAGTFGLMLLPILGIEPESTVPSKTIYDGMVYTGIALQLTNILKDVSDDACLGRVYLPQDELAQFGLCDEDIYSKRITEGWKEFMKMQIQRAKFYYSLGEQGVSQLDKSSSSKFHAATMVYRLILDEIEERDYDNLTSKVAELTL